MLLVVLDAYRSSLGCAECADAQQVRQGAVVDGDRLGDLEEPDELELVQPLGAGLIRVDGRQRAYGWTGGDEPVDGR